MVDYAATTVEEKILANLSAILLANVTGLKASYQRAPFSLPESDLPANVNLLGPLDDVSNRGPGIDLITRTIYVRFYCAHIQQGVSGDAESTVIPFLSSVPPVLRARTSLNTGTKGTGVPGLLEATYQGVKDGGISVLPSYSGDQYLGVEFRLRVRYMERYTFAAYQ